MINMKFQKKPMSLLITLGLACASSVSVANESINQDHRSIIAEEIKEDMRFQGGEQVEREKIANALRQKMRAVEVERILNQAFIFSEQETRDIKSDGVDIRKALKGPAFSEPNQKNVYYQIDPTASQVFKVKVAPGYPSNIIFSDRFGNPWKYQAIINGDEGSFGHFENGNLLTVFAKQPEARASITAVFDGLQSRQISFIIETDYSLINTSVNVTIDAISPDNEITSSMLDYDVFASDQNSDPIAINILNSEPLPEGAVVRKIEGINHGYVYHIGDYYYLEMPYRLVTPFWHYGATAPNGKRIYKIDETYRIQVNVDGRKKWFNIGGPIDIKHISKASK